MSRYIPLTRVLRHYKPVLIIQVGQTEGVLRHVVEEFLLSFEIILHCLVIVQMVARQVGENTTCKTEPADTFLVDRVRTHFHEDILAPGVCHLS